MNSTDQPKPDMTTNIQHYGHHYSANNFWQKIKSTAETAGATVVFTALLLYYVLRSPHTPLVDKALVTGALGYFILPIDLIADVLPGIGFTDDAAAMTTALITVASNITPEVVNNAKQQLRQWFANVDEATLDTVVDAVRKGSLLKRKS